MNLLSHPIFSGWLQAEHFPSPVTSSLLRALQHHLSPALIIFGLSETVVVNKQLQSILAATRNRFGRPLARGHHIVQANFQFCACLLQFPVPLHRQFWFFWLLFVFIVPFSYPIWRLQACAPCRETAHQGKLRRFLVNLYGPFGLFYFGWHVECDKNVAIRSPSISRIVHGTNTVQRVLRTVVCLFIVPKQIPNVNMDRSNIPRKATCKHHCPHETLFLIRQSALGRGALETSTSVAMNVSI